MSTKNLIELNDEDLKEFQNSFDTVLCDIDGVIWYTNRGPISGAKETLEKLRKIGKKIIFVTNNCTVTLKKLHERLKNAGHQIEEGDIINPSVVLIDYLKKNNFQKKIFIFSIDGLKKQLKEEGYELLDAHDLKIENKLLTDILKMMEKIDDNVGAVYIDTDIEFNYVALQHAVFYLKKPDVLLFASGNDKILPFTETSSLIGPGFLLEIFEEMTGKTASIMGKPGDKINRYVSRKIKSTPARTLFIGDSLEQDVKFAKEHGYQSLFIVSSGEKIKKDENSIVPDYYVKDLKSLGEILK